MSSGVTDDVDEVDHRVGGAQVRSYWCLVDSTISFTSSAGWLVNPRYCGLF